MPTPRLKEFIASLPSCGATTPLAAVLEMFSHNQCDRLMIVTEQQHPLGLLHLSSLLPYLTPTTEPSRERDCLPHWRHPLSELGLSIIEPLATLPADLSLQQCQTFLQAQQDRTNSTSDWAVVDPTGKFLGLLDSGRLLQFLLAHPQATAADSQPKASDTETETWTEAAIPPSRDPHPLTFLAQLLERLPLPLMLQTSSGQVLKQNLAWQGHFGSLQDPDWLRQEAAAVLETLPHASSPSPGNQPHRATRRGRANLPQMRHPPATADEREAEDFLLEMLANGDAMASEEPVAAEKRTKPKGRRKDRKESTASGIDAEANSTLEASRMGVSLLSSSPSIREAHQQPGARKRLKSNATLSSWCQIGPNPDACICVCPMQNGAERVWQFIKIPLGNVLSSPDLMWEQRAIATATESLPYPLPSQPFRLGHLGISADNLDSKVPLNSTQHSLQGADLWLVMAQDVTEQHLVAKELAAKNADLIQLNRLKDEFLACISHELKTPLTAVLGLSSLLKDQLLGALNDRQARYARLIHQSGRHLMTVVNDILDLTRIETGQLELLLSQVEIAAVCDRAYQQARQLYLMQHNAEQEEGNTAADEARFTWEIEPGLESIVADELRLRQMLVHLLSNALKFTETGGAIGLQISRWEGWIAFTVWDTGIGIPEQKQHLIFQKFQQLENPLTRQFQGTGLGLVLTQRLARLHGGDVSFISREGQGSQFTLLLPPCPPQKAGSEEDKDRDAEYPIPNIPSPVPYAKSRLVLIVETTSRFIEDLSEKLTGLGYRVAIARSGTEALAKARALQPRAILLNPLLPLLSGWDVLTLLKSNAQTRHIPVIVTATMVEKKQAYSNRADDFLSMPVQLSALQQSLEHLIALPMVHEEEAHQDSKLTILYLTTCEKNRTEQPQVALEPGILPPPSPVDSYTSNAALSRLLHRHHYRVLEADDLEQAELLARIWQPHVVLLERGITNPLIYLQQLSQYPALAILPLVTLDRETTEAANQVKGLSIFPCLEPPSPAATSALLQAIQVAAGMSWKPSILFVDLSMLPDLSKPVVYRQPSVALAGDSPDNQGIGMIDRSKKRAEWQKALIQYLQTAGFKVVIAHSWDEVLRQIQHHSIDLLLIELGESTPQKAVGKAFRALKQFTEKPPTLLLDRRLKASDRPQPCQDDGKQRASNPPPEFLTATTSKVIQDVATKILPASLSMKELLNQIRQTLAQTSSRVSAFLGNR